MKKDSRLSVRRQCELLGINRSTVYYEQKEPEEEAVRLKAEVMGHRYYQNV